MAHIQRKGFRQITQEERVEIYSFFREGLRMREIGRRLERSHTSISREIARNGIDYGWWKVVYKPIEAEKKCRKRKDRANRSHVKLRKKGYSVDGCKRREI
jgi:transposase, IS30 family